MKERGDGETGRKTFLLQWLDLENIKCVSSVVQSLNNAQGFV